jgi:hypothetical protein
MRPWPPSTSSNPNRSPRRGSRPLDRLPIYLHSGFKCRNSIHFTTCFNFEQSLPKWVTCHEFWSTNPALRMIVRSSGGPSLGRSPGAHKQRRPVNQDQSLIRENRVDTIFGAGLSKSCSFFIWRSSSHFPSTGKLRTGSLALEKVRSDVGLLLDRIEIAKNAVGKQRVTRDHVVLVELDRV